MDSVSFSDYPEDMQLSILSFLSPKEIANFACTSKGFVSLSNSDHKVWYYMCKRRWGTMTQINKWGDGKVSYKLLYKTLDEWENLIGFWGRRYQPAVNFSSPQLIFFEWGPSFVAGSKVCPSQNGTYNVLKSPFLWMSLSSDGEIVNLLQLNGEIKLWDDFVKCCQCGFVEDFISVNVNFMGGCHVLVEENYDSFYPESPSSTNLNPRAHDGERRRRWEREHFVKIVNCSPTPARPLQGLWKGLCDDINLDFYLVAYDVMGINCQRLYSLSSWSAGEVFWTSNTAIIRYPFSPEEEYLYDSRIHRNALAAANHIQRRCPLTEDEVVSRIMYINSSYNSVIQDLVGASAKPQQGDGRIWQYKDGTFGFGFFRDNFITDLKHMVQDGFLLDAEV